VTTTFTLLESRFQQGPQTAAFAEWLQPDGVRSASFYRAGAGYLVRFPELADFEISSDALAIRCHPVPSVSEATCRNIYLNQVLPLALSKRGKLVFHASSVELPSGEALIFAGRSGSGKSTLAAAFAAAGGRFLSDDGSVVEENGDGYLALPSHPSLRLWSDSASAVIGRRVPAKEPVSKSRIAAGARIAFCGQPRQLACICFLGDAGCVVPRFERPPASAALIELVRNCFLLDIEERSALASHFDRLTKLVLRVPCFRLHYARRFDALDGLVGGIVEHCRGAQPVS
jgi:hypothetical protein